MRKSLMAVQALLTGSLLLAGPNLSGSWTLDTARSDFGGMPGPTKMTWKIQHSDPDLKIDWMLDGSRGVMEGKSKYLTNGEPTNNFFGEITTTNTAKWEDSILKMHADGKMQGGEFSIDDSWKLSADGNTLTVTRDVSSSMGSIRQTLVFVKE